MSKNLFRRMKLIDWQLVHPEQLKVKPEAIQCQDKTDESQSVQAWIIGETPRWWNDLCRVLHISEYRCLTDVEQLPDDLLGAWLFVNETPSMMPVNGKVITLVPQANTLNKKQIWEQLCRYEF